MAVPHPLLSGAFSTTPVYMARPNSKSNRSARVLNKLYDKMAGHLISFVQTERVGKKYLRN